MVPKDKCDLIRMTPPGTGWLRCCPTGWVTAGPQHTLLSPEPRHGHGQSLPQTTLQRERGAKHSTAFPEPGSELFPPSAAAPRCSYPSWVLPVHPTLPLHPSCLQKAIRGQKASQLRSRGVRAPCLGSLQPSAKGDGWEGQAGDGRGSVIPRQQLWTPQGLRKICGRALPLPQELHTSAGLQPGRPFPGPP